MGSSPMGKGRQRVGDLKPGWKRVKFGEVVRLGKERCTDPAADGITRYIGLEHLEPGDLRIRSWGDIAEGTTFTSRVRPGQVLFGKRRAYQRKVAVADFDAVCSGDIYVFESIDSKRLLPELLPFLCQTDAFFDHAVGTSAGSLSPRTNWTSLAEYKFALPPPEEQRRLVQHLSAWTYLAEAEGEACVAATRIKRSLLVETFRPDRGTRDVFPAHWITVPIGEAGDCQLGQQRHPMFESGSNVRPYLRVANVMDGAIDFSNVLSMHFPEDSICKFELAPGDILLNEGQSAELVGRSAVFRGELPGACFQKTLLRFRCGPGLLPEFAQAFFQHMLYTGQFARVAVQTTSMAHLTGVRFAKLPIPVPPLQEQRVIVERLAQVDVAQRLLAERRRIASENARCAASQMVGA
jgi:type I restriction enzyme S subunit